MEVKPVDRTVVLGVELLEFERANGSPNEIFECVGGLELDRDMRVLSNFEAYITPNWKMTHSEVEYQWRHIPPPNKLAPLSEVINDFHELIDGAELAFWGVGHCLTKINSELEAAHADPCPSSYKLEHRAV
jgi:hypothetical protein